MAKGKLWPPRWTRFVAEYVVDLNATKAAIRAGYAPKAAKVMGSRLLGKRVIKDAIAKKQAKVIEKVDLTAERVLEEIRRLAFFDPRDFWNEDGDLIPVRDLTAEQAAALAGFEVIIKNAKAGDGITDTIHKVKLTDKLGALELAAKHLGLLKDRIELSGAVGLLDPEKIGELSDEDLETLTKAATLATQLFAAKRP